MKRPPIRNRRALLSGFTLVELLVVIAIIAILASVTLTVGNTVIKAAKKAKAANTAGQIQTACLAYYTEYSVYPVPTATTGDYYIGDTSAADGASWAILMEVLGGNIKPSDGTQIAAPTAGPLNSRSIAFLAMKSSDVYTAADHTGNAAYIQDAPKNPLPISTTASIFFNLEMDSDYSGVIGDSASAYKTQMPNFTVTPFVSTGGGGTSTAGVAVWANCNASATLNTASNWVHTY